MTTTQTVKILGRFVYQAEVLPPRSRVPRRMDLWAPAEYEIRTANPNDVATNAVVVQPRLDLAGHAGAIQLSFSAYDGQLFSPMKLVERNGEVRNFAHRPSLKVEDYLTQSSGEFPEAWACDDPILAAYNAKAGTSNGRLPSPITLREDHFSGEILRSNRAESLARHCRAANDVLFVGDDVLVRRPEPTWTIGSPDQYFGTDRLGGGIALTGLVNFNVSQRFRLDRLDDAIAFRSRTNPNGSSGVHGEVITADFSLLRRDDLACMIADVLQSTLQGAAAITLPHFSNDEVKAWSTLNEFAKQTWHGTFRDDRIALDASEATLLLRSISDALHNPSLPSYLDKHRLTAIGEIDQLLLRAKFEIERRPVMKQEDEEALSIMSTTP